MNLRRFNDVVIALFLFLVSLPVLLFSCLALWLEWPVFPVTCVERVTQDGSLVRLYRLRTTGRDSRPTVLGEFLRSMHLDYVPQLLNVLNGDLSLVGTKTVSEEGIGDKSLLALREP